MQTYPTIAGTLNTLKEEGYILDFNLRLNCVECKSPEKEWYTDDFIKDKFFRFEGASNPDDSAIVYAISSKDGLKGTLGYAYGVYADSLTNEMVEKLKIKR